MKFCVINSLLLLLALALPAAAGEPFVNIPFVDGNTVSGILDGDPFAAENWAGAAVAGRFTSVGGSSLIPERTEILLQHDGENIYALARCSDSKPGWRAWPRAGHEDLSMDESVEILFGTGEGSNGQLQFGGYEGAFSELGEVEHFYQFACNRAGSFARRYDETALPEAGFLNQVVDYGSSWEAVFVIPFEKAGILPGQRAVHFNAFRFYRSGRYGWHLPAWGTYVPTPFGKARLLSAGAQEEITREKPEFTPAEVSAAVKNAAVPATSAEIAYYPLQNSITAKFPAGMPEQSAWVAIKNGTGSEKVQLCTYRSTVITVPCSGVPGTVVEAEAFIDGKAVASVKAAVPEKPEWDGTAAGIKYLDEKVSAPWEPLTVDGGIVAGKFTTFDFGDGMLPENIQTTGGSVLAGAVSVYAEAAGAPLPVNGRDSTVNAGPWVLMKSATEAGIEIRTRVEYDGFTVVRMRLNGIPATELSALEVHIPIDSRFTGFLHRGNVQTLLMPGGRGYVGNGGEIWVGDVDAGLFVDFDRKAFFSPSDGGQVELIPVDGNVSDLVLRLVTAPGQVTDPEQVFQFFLLPTPFRNDFIPPDKNDLSLWFENWSDWQGYPDLAKMPEVKRRAAEADNAGQRLYMYFSQSLAQDAPGFDLYRNELVAPPGRSWYKRAYDPGKDVPCWVICFRGSGGDMILDGVHKLVNEGGLDGVYLDGPSHPFDCANPSHLCDDSLNAAWDDDYTAGRILGQRAFLKRLRGILDEAGHEFPVWAHTGGGLSLSTLALTDYFFEGEQLARYKKGYLLEPEKMLINYSGAPYGFRGLFLPVLYFDNWECTRALPWGLLHGVSSFEFADLQTHYFKQFKRAGGVFYPYWREQPQLERKTMDGNLVSYWIGSDCAMVVASNLRYQGIQRTELDIGGFFPGRKVAVKCLNSAEGFAVDGTRVTLDVPEAQMRLVMITIGDFTE